MANKKPTAKELVKEKYPTAFVDDDGDWVYIHITRLDESRCPHCNQTWRRQVIDYMHGPLGSGGSTEYAWQKAAENLGLL